MPVGGGRAIADSQNAPLGRECMANKIESKCLTCGELFTADARNRGRQMYRGKPEYQRESKAATASQRAD
jgi:hypothetical protein